jgi:hypothetical protein
VIATAFSSFTLWLLDSWIKYPLFTLEIFTIIVLCLIFSDYEFKLNVARIKIGSIRVDLAIDAFLVASAIILLLFTILLVQESTVQLVLSLLVTSILPGYTLLNIFGLSAYFSKLEKVVISYILSYAFTGFMTLSLLLANENVRALCILISYILLGLISATKHRKQRTLPTPKSLTKNTDSLGLLVAITFLAVSFYLIYPGFALLPGTDISRHYSWSIILNRTPDLYIGSAYLFAHLHESMFLALSNPSLASAQTALLAINLMLPLAFYVMAKPYLEKIDARLPSIATMFWILFTNSFGGFSWLYFAYLKLSSPNQTQLQLLSLTADKTYNGTIYGILGLWYVPATISFIVLMAAIFLLSKKEIPETIYLALFSITITALYLTHVTEALIFVLFLALYGAISKNANLKIGAALKASLISFVLISAVYYAFSQFTSRFTINLPLLTSIVLPTFLLTVSLIIRHFRLRIPAVKFRFKEHLKSAPKTFVLLLIFAYFTALLSWISFLGSFHTSQVDPIGVVPWFMYPLMLGITGLLSMITLYYIAENAGQYKSLRFFIVFMIFAFIAGTFVSLLNLYVFNVDYWEKRFIWFIKLPLALLAPIPILILIDRLKKHISVNFKTVFSIALIGTVCLYGVSTTFLNVEYWNITATNPANYPSSVELSAIDAFKKILDNDPRAWSATVTTTSANTAVLAGPADTLVLRQLLYAVHTPEMALTQLYRSSIYSHPYIYLDDRDLLYLNIYPNQFLSKYLLQTLPTVFSNSEVEIYNVSKLSFPQSIGESVLIIPFDESIQEQNILMAYYALSYGLYNYTVAYDMDHNALNSNTVVLPFDPPEGNTLANAFQDEFNQTLDSWSVVKGNWSIEGSQLLGGAAGNSGEGVILAPVIAENFSATVKIKLLSGNATVLNYASFLYSWIDSKNYRVADFVFNSDGYIYLLFRDFVNGVETDSPNWPGLKTSLKWSFGDEYAAKLTVNGALKELSINDTTLSLSDSENIPGKVGLRYYRFSRVFFDDFFINYTKSLNLRPANDYLNYLNSGGRLIVLNTNGDGLFAKDLFSISNSMITVKQINSNFTTINLPYELSVPLLTLKDSDTKTISSYSGSEYEIPLILQKNYGNGGELFYVNVYPIVQTMQTSNNQSAFYELIGKLLNGINLTKLSPTTPLSSFNGYVKEIYLKNNTKIETTSIILPSELELQEVEVNVEKSSHVFYDVTNITLSDYSHVIIEPSNATIQNGNGFYTQLQLNSTFSIEPSEGVINLKITAANETYDLSNVDLLSVKPSSSFQLQVRTPTVSASEATFVEFYLQNYEQLTTQIYGQNLNVTSFTRFSMVISDNYQAISNLTLGKYFQNESQATQYDLLSTWPIAMFWSLLLMPVFVSISLIFAFRKPSSEDNKITNEIKKDEVV